MIEIGSIPFKKYKDENLCWFFNDRDEYENIIANYSTRLGIDDNGEFSIKFVLKNADLIDDLKIEFTVLDTTELDGT